MTGVWLPAAPCTPAGCADRPDRPAAVPLAVLRLVAGCTVGLLGVPGALLVRPLGPRARHAAVRCWARTLLRAFGVRVRHHGWPRPVVGHLVAPNHVSWLDVPLVAGALPGRMLAKSEVRGYPGLGFLAARAGTLFIDRDRLRALPGTVAGIAGALRAGAHVTVFPEGSTWCGRAQGRFRPAAFQAALDAGAAVQPVRIDYRLPDGGLATAAAFVGDDPLGASLWRVVRARGVTAELRLLPRIPAGRYGDRRDLARAVQEAVADAVPLPPPDVRHAPAGRSVPAPLPLPRQAAVASESANRPAASVHHRESSSPAAASSAATRS
ncbi:1-acyl-sn-glycerol-3-phosphate acyltransferase [Streptomyces sp. NRRL S-87]|uniref:lysophospholipid acyltransferase family protein n=1 Tax=Streptomyces sp. NRRL S-87 TaxID=1463920 RepID=UPI0004C13225|nr:lysophospholipid acyltransferase family protein [Streptomyces sp. NRRL S-87]